jgi:hypothetical protein
MCFLPYKGKDKLCTHRLVHPTFIREVVVTDENLEVIAKLLGITPAKLKAGATLHVLQEIVGRKGPKKRR